MSSITQIPLEVITKGKKIGSGAHSDVFFGNWNGKPVAIKELRSLEGTSLEALEKEAGLLSSLKHPNIVAFHGLINKTHHFVFAFIANGSLHSLIMDKSTTTWKVGQRLNICKDMTKGLSYLHSQNVIHRDFKSPNILIDEHFRAIISDFGISKIVQQQTFTHTGGIGTVAWMAPEQFESGHYKASVDIYALGLVIWEVFEEKQPFAGSTISEIMMKKIMQKQGEELTEKTPENLHELLKNCWQEASKRPSAEEVLKWLENTPIRFKNKQAMIQAVQKEDLETLEKLIILEETAQEPIASQSTPAAVIPTSISPLVPEIAFGAKDWNTYFGDVGKEPPLPSNIEEILQSPCPFSPEWRSSRRRKEKIRDTHFLCLIPKTVNGNPLTLDSLGELVKNRMQGNPIQYRGYSDLQEGYGSDPVERSYWVLMTKDIIFDSECKPYKNQKALVEKEEYYGVPSVIEAATVILMHTVKTGNYIFKNVYRGPHYTGCLRKVLQGVRKMRRPNVGNMSETGLEIIATSSDGQGYGGGYGVAASRRFY